MYGEANAVYWKSFERQNSTHLTLLKHQITKTALYMLPKNDWVIPLFWNLRASQKQITCDSLFWSPCRLLGRAKNISCIQDQYIDVLPNLTSGGITCGKGWGERSIKERSRLFSDPWIPLYSPMLSLTYQWIAESDLSGNIRLLMSKYRVQWI